MLTFFLRQLRQAKASGFLVFAYALLGDFLVLAFVLFLGLFTLEILLPGFVSVRLNMAILGGTLILLALLFIFLGRYLDVSLSAPNRPGFTGQLSAWLAGLWLIALLALALYGFPWPILALLLVVALALYLLFRSLLLGTPEE